MPHPTAPVFILYYIFKDNLGLEPHHDDDDVFVKLNYCVSSLFLQNRFQLILIITGRAVSSFFGMLLSCPIKDWFLFFFFCYLTIWDVVFLGFLVDFLESCLLENVI
ncbi:hypothetical protein QQ045_007497 [Rhodiola kirilowii]